MTEEKTNKPRNPFSPQWANMVGTMGTLFAGAMALWTTLSNRKTDEELRDYDRERAAQDEIELLKKMRAVERDEQAHLSHQKYLDMHLDTQLDYQAAARADRLANEARKRSYEAQETYWKAKLEREVL